MEILYLELLLGLMQLSLRANFRKKLQGWKYKGAPTFLYQLPIFQYCIALRTLIIVNFSLATYHNVNAVLYQCIIQYCLWYLKK
jgi:hypothetical protein